MAVELDKAIAREVFIDGKIYVVTFAHAGISLREKGKRTEYGPVSWGLVLLKGQQAAACALLEEKDTTRRAKKVSRGRISVGV